MGHLKILFGSLVSIGELIFEYVCQFDFAVYSKRFNKWTKVQMELFDEKNQGGQKSRDTVPLNFAEKNVKKCRF
jgi:hypothetical protein